MGLNINRFSVKNGHEAEFVRMNDEDWPQLFGRSADYMGTEIAQHIDDSSIYLTVDRWASEDAFYAFVAENRPAFDALCARHREHFTEVEHVVFHETQPRTRI